MQDNAILNYRLTAKNEPDDGEVLINGLSSKNTLARQYLGYLPENPIFYDHLTACELLEFSGYASGMDKRQLKPGIDPLLEKMELLPFKKRAVRNFSKGMKQRLGLAMALLHDPQIFILDEPMSGLDPLGRRLITDVILELRDRKKTVFFSSHILSDVERLCDRIGILNKGNLLFSGVIDEIAPNGSPLEDAFINLIEQHNRDKYV